MIEIDIPGRGLIRLEHLVTDVNGTIAKDGCLLDEIAQPLMALKDRLTIHLITADTHGRQDSIDAALALNSVRLAAGNQAEQKAAYVRSLGAETVVAMGNGANDALMLKEAAIGIAVMGEEGLAVEALMAADVFSHSAREALALFDFPTRLVATLRR
ncbi:MAG: ATPase P [Chloroflexi bacterium]|nr:ATPase P [Chloroflexota bacterium]